MKLALLLTLSSLLLVSCNQDTKEEKKIEVKVEQVEKQSKELLEYLPLLPHVEKNLWQKLLAAEESKSASSEITRISNLLRERYPFTETEEYISLGGIRYDKKNRQIEIPAMVSYPKEGDERHPEELELILCSNRGRIHETLFVSDAQPLHLEMLMRIAGFKKSIPASVFKVSVSLPNSEPIAVEDLMELVQGGSLPEPLLWEFSGSDFHGLYPPDQTGDFIICWHAHPSVLRVKHDKIANGEMKLKAKSHVLLEQGMKVKIILAPQKR